MNRRTNNWSNRRAWIAYFRKQYSKATYICTMRELRIANKANKESGQLALLFVIGMLVIVGMFALGYTAYIHEITAPFAKLYLALGQ